MVACRRVAELGKSSFWFELEVETPQEAFAVVVVNLHTIWSLFPGTCLESPFSYL